MKKFLPALLFLCVLGWTQNSPFSVRGLGLESSPYQARALGMGHAGLAYLSPTGASIRNPSKLGFNRFTSLEMMFEMGLDYIQDNETSNTLGGSRIPFFALNFQAGKLGNLGLHYFQRFDRRFSFSPPEEGSGISSESSRYEGGSYELAFSWGRAVGKHVSLGLGYNLLLGQDRKIIETRFPDDDFIDLEGDSTITRRRGSYPVVAGTLHFRKFNLALSGNIPILPLEERVQRRVHLQGVNPPETEEYDFPLTLALGGLYQINRHQSVVLDVITTDWDHSLDSEINRSWQVGTGYERIGSGDKYDKLYKRMAYRGGVGYEQSYIQKVDVYKVTTGLGIPLGNRGSTLDLAFEYGHRGSLDTYSVVEDYVKMYLAFKGAGLWGQTRRRR